MKFAKGRISFLECELDFIDVKGCGGEIDG